MKNLHFALKLCLPYFILRLWVEKHYRMTLAPVGASSISRAALAVLPAFFAAALSQRTNNDRSPLKYFLPYPVMVKRVWRQYRMTHFNGIELDATRRTLCPFGIVLWRESLEKPRRTARNAQPGKKTASPVKQPATRDDLESFCREMTLRMDRIELLLLRMATKDVQK